nr:FAD:protein FMN transferase [uncultured Cupriavidus sp.]
MIANHIERQMRCRRARPLLGTLVDVDVLGTDAHRAMEAAFAAMATVHRLMNRHDPDSDIGRLNAAPSGSTVRIHSQTHTVLTLASILQRDSDGLFDCTRHPDWQGWLRWELRDDAVYKEGNGAFDLGGIAKGYAVDCAIEAISQFDVDHALVNAGGDLRHLGSAATAISVRDPAWPTRMMVRCEIFNEALASSSVAGLAPAATALPRIVGKHNALALQAGASIVAPTCMVADALTKVVLASGLPLHPLLARYSARTLLYRDARRDSEILFG